MSGNGADQDMELFNRAFFLIVTALSLAALTIGSVGSRSVGIVGLILCLPGFAMKPALVDLWAFIPMLVYELINAVSTYVT